MFDQDTVLDLRPFYSINFDPLPAAMTVIGQWIRWAIKRTFWTPLTTFFKRIGKPLQSVQVLVVDRRRGLVLLLRTPESRSGYFPIQGLRKGFKCIPPRLDYDDDPRKDARRELAEEAVAEETVERLLPVEKFRLLRRYWEGRCGQFDCRVYLVEAESRELNLREETSEGLPLWMELQDAQAVLEGSLATLLNELPPAGEAIEYSSENEYAWPAAQNLHKDSML